MKVKTFTGTHRAAVDQQVNDWLARSNVEVRRTSTAFKAFRETGWDAISGRTTSRRAVGIAISVWYDEPVTKVIGNRPPIGLSGSRKHRKSNASNNHRANNHRANATASSAPTICAAMKAAIPAGAMPA